MKNLEEKTNIKLLEKIDNIINNNSISHEQAREILREVFAMREALIFNKGNLELSEDLQSYLKKRMEKSWKSLSEYIQKRIYSQEEAEMIFRKIYGISPNKL